MDKCEKAAAQEEGGFFDRWVGAEELKLVPLTALWVMALDVERWSESLLRYGWWWWMKTEACSRRQWSCCMEAGNTKRSKAPSRPHALFPIVAQNPTTVQES